MAPTSTPQRSTNPAIPLSGSSIRTRSAGPVTLQKARRPRLTPSQKLHQLTEIMEADFGWNPKQFFDAYVEIGSSATLSRTPQWRRRKLFDAYEGHVSELYKSSHWFQGEVLSEVARVVRSELANLIEHSTYFGAWSADTSLDSVNLSVVHSDMHAHAPSLMTLLSFITLSNRASWKSQPERDPQGPALKLFAVTAQLARLHSRNTSNWWSTILGVHLHMLGTKDRGIELLSKAGYTLHPSSIRTKLAQISEASRASLSTVRLLPMVVDDARPS